MYLLSVIVPVYNAEKYLPECLNHLVKMGSKAQIILADDGSTDCSYSICKEYASKNKNFVLLQEENKGPSGARNLALQFATGKYVVFCDSDDWLDERIITELEKHESKNIDFFQFGINGDFDLLYDETTFLTAEQRLDLFSLIVGLRDKRNIGHGYFGLVTCKIFRRELLEGVEFDLDVVGEDTLYAVQAFAKINSAVFLPYRFYNYRYVEGSYSRRYFPGIVPMATRMLDLMRLELPDSDLMRNAFDGHAIDKYWWCLYATLREKPTYKEIYKRLSELYRIQVFHTAFMNKEIQWNSLKNRMKFTFMHFGMLRPIALLVYLRRIL